MPPPRFRPFRPKEGTTAGHGGVPAELDAAGRAATSASERSSPGGTVALRARQMLSRKAAPEPLEELQQPAFKLFGAEPFEVREPRLKAAYDGFDLQAATAFEAYERRRGEVLPGSLP